MRLVQADSNGLPNASEAKLVAVVEPPARRAVLLLVARVEDAGHGHVSVEDWDGEDAVGFRVDAGAGHGGVDRI